MILPRLRLILAACDIISLFFAEAVIITPEESGYAPFSVDAAYVRKHQPKVGGYYVVYKDGYKSFSPAQAFEEGYSRV